MAQEAPTIRIIGFKTTYELMPQKGGPLDDNVDAKGFRLDAKGQRIMDRESIDWITYAPAHSPLATRTTDRVKHMKPDIEKMGNDPEGRKFEFMQHRWAQIEPAYRAWKEGRETPMNGTALAVWPGLSPEQIEVFHSFGVKTVEDVAHLSESQMEKIRLPNMRELKSQAGLFLANVGSSQAAQVQQQMAEQMAAMKAQMDDMRKALDLANKEDAAEPTNAGDVILNLRSQLDAKGIEYDRRWAEPKLRAKLAEAA